MVETTQSNRMHILFRISDWLHETAIVSSLTFKSIYQSLCNDVISTDPTQYEPKVSYSNYLRSSSALNRTRDI